MSWWKKDKADEEDWLKEVEADSQPKTGKVGKVTPKTGFSSGIEDDDWGYGSYGYGYGYGGGGSGGGSRKRGGGGYGSSYGGGYGGSYGYGSRYGGGYSGSSWDFKKSSLGSSLSSYSYGSYYSSDVGDRNKALRTLRTVHRTANAILQLKGMSISVQFPSKKKEDTEDTTTQRSDLSKGIMVLDPKEAIAAHDDNIKNNSLQGRSLIFSQMFMDKDERDFERYKKPESDDGVIDTARYLWECAAMGAARRNLLEDWAGFRDYCNDYSRTYSLKRGLTHITGEEEGEALEELKKTLVQQIVTDPKGGLGELIGRNLAHGDFMLLDYPDDTSPEIIEATFNLETAPAAERFTRAKELAELLVKEGQNSPKSSGPNGGGGTGSMDGTMMGTEEIEGEQSYASLDAVSDKRTEEYDHTVRSSDGNSVQPTIHFLDPEKEKSGGMSVGEFQKEWAEMKRVADKFVSAFMFRNVESQQYDYGLRSGDLDEGGLHKLAYTDTLFCRREEPDIKKVTVCILLDESGSMGHNSRYASARKVAVAMVQAMRQVKGIKILVYGHTADSIRYPGVTSAHGHVYLLEYLTPTCSDEKKLRFVRARSNNCDGHAMKHAGLRAIDASPEDDYRVMFVLSDGSPNSHGYGGDTAAEHMDSVCKMLRKNGLSVYGVSIEGGFDDDFGKKAYGDGKYVLLNDTMSSASIMANFLARVTSRM